MGIPTYLPIANITLGSAAGSVTFSGITQQYRDLVLVVNGTITSGTGSYYLMFNGDMSANSSYNVTLEANGSSVISAKQGQWSGIWGPYNYNTVFSTSQSSHTINIMDYSATDKFKTILMRSSNASTAVAAVAGSWGVTSAITTVAFVSTASILAAGTTLALYGVLA